MVQTNVYRLHEENKTFSSSITNTFGEVDQQDCDEDSVNVLPFGVSRLKHVLWCVNAVGYVELFWELKDGSLQRILVLSGNGRWDLDVSGDDFMKPNNSTGKLFLSTTGFDTLDSYTIILSGIKV